MSRRAVRVGLWVGVLLLLGACGMSRSAGQPTPITNGWASGGDVPRWRVYGQVRDQAGQPMQLVEVVLTMSNGATPARPLFTDAQGFYSWEFGPGSYTVQLRRPGYRQASVRGVLPLDALGSGAEVRHDLVMEKEPERLNTSTR